MPAVGQKQSSAFGARISALGGKADIDLADWDIGQRPCLENEEIHVHTMRKAGDACPPDSYLSFRLVFRVSKEPS
jgi:hypothetical protein